jgi:hypothetical protein
LLINFPHDAGAREGAWHTVTIIGYLLSRETKRRRTGAARCAGARYG